MDDIDDDWLHDNTVQRQGGEADPLTSKEYDRISSKYYDAGYREGITDGKLSTLQQGFDDSYTSSVSPSRHLGSLRGRASSLLALHTTLRPSAHPAIITLLDNLRDLVRDLDRVKRAQILPIDTEREEHERDQHGEEGDENGFELEGNEKRGMEGLEDMLESMGGGGDEGAAGKKKREADLLKELDGRLERIEAELKSSTA